MYGYLRTCSDELKVKQVRLYKKYYCTQCTVLNNKIGLLYRFLTSYDITLFLMIFDYLSQDKMEYDVKCPTKRMHYKFGVSESAANYSLLVCLFWIREKLRDDVKDEKKHRILRRIFNCNKKIKQILNAKQVTQWDEFMVEYYKKEQDETASFDDLVTAMGMCYGTVFKDYGDYANINVDNSIMFELGSNIGKYIYIMDAYDDYFDDLKKKRFNPFLRMIGYKDFDDERKEISARVEFILDIITRNIYRILQEHFVEKSDEFWIIENILGFGIWKKYNLISKKYEKSEKTKFNRDR